MGQTSACSTAEECKALAAHGCGGCRDPDRNVEVFFNSQRPDGAADDVFLWPCGAPPGVASSSPKCNDPALKGSGDPMAVLARQDSVGASMRPSYRRGGSRKSERPASLEAPSTRHLVINMDINRTIIMTDATGGKTMEMIINETLAHAAWGEASADGESWVLRINEPSVLRPGRESDADHRRNLSGARRRGSWATHLISYSEWLERSMPGAKNRKKRQSVMATFTEPGQPGEALASYRVRALEELRYADGSDVRIIPAFFELLLWLKREKRSFSICFRTFGEDLGDVADELTSFCEGRHPLFPNVCMDGSDGEPDYRFSVQDKESCGTFFRDKECISLIMGTTEQPGEGKYRDAEDRSLEFFKLFPGVRIIKGLSAVQQYWRAKVSCCKTFGIRDYFQYWKSVGMTSDGGKLFFYYPSRYTQQHQIFFDDNIHYDDFFIVQPVNLEEVRQHNFPARLLNTHVCRAEPLESIFDRHYFIKHIVRLERGYEQKLIVREKLKTLMWKFFKNQKIGERARKSEIYDPWAQYRTISEDVAVDRSFDLEEARAF